MCTRQRPPGFHRVPRGTKGSAAFAHCEVETGSPVLQFQYEADSTDSMEKVVLVSIIDLFSKPGDVDVDDVVKRRVPGAFFPNFPRQHLARNWMAEIAEEVFQQIEFPGRQVERFAASERGPRDNVQLQIGDSEL